MQGIPWFSTFTLFTEILVTASVLYVFHSGYRYNKFPYALVALTLGYEICFNITYMASRALSRANPSRLENGTAIGLAIFHGSFSLLMFLGLIVYMVIAWVNYKKGVNYFLRHNRFTATFILLWLAAVLSGIAFYVISYF